MEVQRLPSGSAVATYGPDERAFRALFATESSFVRRILAKWGLSDAAVDDATQEVFAIAARRWCDMVPGSERAFLYGVARRVAARTRQATRPWQPIDDNIPDPAASPEDAATARRERDQLTALLSEMKEDTREALILFDVEGMPKSLVAAKLGIPEGTAASRLRRAREELAGLVRRLRATRAWGAGILLGMLAITRRALAGAWSHAAAAPVTWLAVGSVVAIVPVAQATRSWPSVLAQANRPAPATARSSAASVRKPSMQNTSNAEAQAAAAYPPAHESAAPRAAGVHRAAPTASAAPAPDLATTPTIGPSIDTLKEQTTMLANVRAALRADEGESALVELDAYERRFSSGALLREARVLRAEALVATGELERAKSLARSLLVAEPDSMYAARLRAVASSGRP